MLKIYHVHMEKIWEDNKMPGWLLTFISCGDRLKLVAFSGRKREARRSEAIQQTLGCP